jgi:hypothetical protein
MAEQDSNVNIYICGTWPLFLMIAGGVMYGICKDVGEFDRLTNTTNMDCGGNDNISDIGWILLWGSKLLHVELF